ncbi:MAG: hypothetical protein H7832_00945 [Magnetococcus sp. DMHC-6]
MSSHNLANIWLESCKKNFDDKLDLIWFNLVLEKHYGFISNDVWQMLCRIWPDIKTELGEAGAWEDVFAILKERFPLLPLLGPNAMDSHSDQEIMMTTLISIHPFCDLFGDDIKKQADEIKQELTNLLTVLQTGETMDEDKYFDKINILLKEINTKLSTPYPSFSIDSRDASVKRIQKISSRVTINSDKWNELFSKDIRDISSLKLDDLGAGVKWVMPDNVLMDTLEKEGFILPSLAAMKRAFQLLGVSPNTKSTDPEIIEGRFLVQFKLKKEYWPLIRKPTMFSGGFPRIYATYFDSKRASSQIQGFGLTVDLKDRQMGLQEAIVPTELLKEMAVEIKLVGVLPPFEINLFNDVLLGPNFIEEVSTNRLQLLGIRDLFSIYASLKTRDTCSGCLPRC